MMTMIEYGTSLPPQTQQQSTGAPCSTRVPAWAPRRPPSAWVGRPQMGRPRWAAPPFPRCAPTGRGS